MDVQQQEETTVRDAERLRGEAWKQAMEVGDARALRDLALVELVAGVGLRAADARLLTVPDVLLDPAGAPFAVALADGDAELGFSGAVALSEWLRAREAIVPAGRALLVTLDGDEDRPGGRSRDLPMGRAETARVLRTIAAAADVPVDADADDPDLTVLGRAPGAWCEDCGARWHSRAMIEGLLALPSCPRCRGRLHTSLERAAPDRPVGDDDAVLAPPRVLGAPRARMSLGHR